jgi:uncharacterized protein
MIVCNSSPIIALASISRLDILPRLTPSIAVPQAVVDECAQGGPTMVPALGSLPWVAVLPDMCADEFRGTDLGKGECQVILHGLRLQSPMVLLDDRLARLTAKRRGLAVMGTLGLLATARQRGYVDSFRTEAQRLLQTGQWLSQHLIDEIARHVGE